jgi:hypothetical protein
MFEQKFQLYKTSLQMLGKVLKGLTQKVHANLSCARSLKIQSVFVPFEGSNTAHFAVKASQGY